MVRGVRLLAGFCLALLVSGIDSSSAASPGGRSGHGKTAQQVTVTPAAVTSPVIYQSPLTICVSGFSQGNFANVNVPMAGTPELHSSIGYSFYIDPTGGLCFTSPPTWTNLNLAPGTYTITVYWHRDGTGTLRSGPATTFTVLSE